MFDEFRDINQKLDNLNPKFEALELGVIKLLEQGRKQMAQIDDLNTAVNTLSDTITSVNTDVTEVITELITLQQTANGPDLSGVIAKLQNANASLTTIDTSLKTVEPNPTGVDSVTGQLATTGGPNASPNPVVPIGTPVVPTGV